MNMFARFDENPAMTQDIKKTKRYGSMNGRENSIPTTNKVCGGYNNKLLVFCMATSPMVTKGHWPFGSREDF